MFGQRCTPVDLVFGAPPEPELPSKPGMDYFFCLRERLRSAHELTRDMLAKAGLKQHRAYDVHARGRDFEVGERVWVYCLTRKRGLSSKLMLHWVGSSTVLAQLSDVVYWVQLVERLQVVVLHCDRLTPYQPQTQSQWGSWELSKPPPPSLPASVVESW